MFDTRDTGAGGPATGVEPPHDLISVVIPTFRRPLAVRAAALSALNQTWPNLEVVVVSDGPDDATRASVAGLDPRLHFIELETNQGPAAARNAGVQASRGIWIAFLDDDDLMLPERLKQQMKLARADRPSVMISCRTLYRQSDRQDLWPKVPIKEGQDVADYILRRPSLLGRPGIVLLQTLLVHRSVLEKVPFSSHADHEDWAWLLEAWHVGGARVLFAWEPLVIYNIDTSSVSRSRRLNWEDSLAWARRYRSYLGDTAYCSFLATKVAIKAKRAGDWPGLRQIAREVLSNRAGVLDLTFLAGVLLLPGRVLQGAWRRSLRSGRAMSQCIGTDHARETPVVTSR